MRDTIGLIEKQGRAPDVRKLIDKPRTSSTPGGPTETKHQPSDDSPDNRFFVNVPSVAPERSCVHSGAG